MWRLLVLLVTAASVLPCSAQRDEPFVAPIKRYALSIGVQNYEHLDHVANAENDAKRVGLALAQVGFVVRPVLGGDTDTKHAILEAVDDVVRSLGGPNEPATIVIYFAGHGFQWSGKDIPPTDYIVPRMARKPRLLDTGVVDNRGLVEDSLDLTELILHLGGSRRAGVTILLLDACRGDVYATAGEKGQKKRGFVEPNSSGVVMNFSTGFNYLAASASRDNPSSSPYAWALEENIPRPSVPLNPGVLTDIQQLVPIRSVIRDQVPVTLNLERAGNFYFDPREREAAQEAELWQKAVTSGDPSCIRTFLAHYPDGRLAQYALTKLEAARPGDHGCILR